MSYFSDLHVVDLSRNVAGPLSGMLLGDLGADVVKIENPRGDDARRHGPPFVHGESAYFLSLNRNKRSVVLDLKQAGGREALTQLLSRADVAISNFRPGVLERLGLPPAQIMSRNPRLVLAQISGFGPAGPWAGRPAYDHIIQGISGLMSITGTEETGPLRVGVSISDVLTGLYTVYGVLTALLERERTGRGQLVDVSLLGATLASLTFQAGQFLTAGVCPQPLGNDHPMIAPYGTFTTADGHVNLAVGNNAMFERLCVTLGCPDLVVDPRFVDNPARVCHRSELKAALNACLARRTTAEWVIALGEAEVAAGPVLRIDEALAHPATLALEMIREVEHPVAGRLRLLGSPVRLSETRTEVRTAPPTLGQHTREVLAEAGCSDRVIRAVIEGEPSP